MRGHPASDSIPSWMARVAWVVGDPSLMSPGTEVDGIQVEHFAPLTVPSDWASIRVLPFSSFLDKASLRAEYERDASPALFLARNEGEMLLAHEIANEHDDVESEHAPPSVIGRRLNRMQRRMALARDNALLDPLTGLINRRGMEAQWTARLERDVSLSRWGLFLLDIDDFKLVNDTYGHLRGDQALAAVASLLLEALPTASLITRWGGEEFAWLMAHADEATSQDLAEAVLRTIRQSPIYLDD
jgi:diguanylate cyclase (GGDEF)-like protein